MTRHIWIRREPELIALPEDAKDWTDNEVWDWLEENKPEYNEWGEY